MNSSTNTSSKIVLWFSVALLVVSVLASAAPLFAYLKWEFLSDPIYWVLQWFCHQRPWRSYHLFDYQYALDARMITLFISLGLSGLFVYFRKTPPLSLKMTLGLVLLALVPMGIDGVTQMVAEFMVYGIPSSLPFYESTNLIRSITGVITGTGLAVALFPHLGSFAKASYPFTWRQHGLALLITLIITLLLIPTMTAAWYLTSNRNRPSSILFDYAPRFPGYNYPIVSEGEHSTITRVVRSSKAFYQERAKAFGKSEYLVPN